MVTKARRVARTAKIFVNFMTASEGRLKDFVVCFLCGRVVRELIRGGQGRSRMFVEGVGLGKSLGWKKRIAGRDQWRWEIDEFGAPCGLPFPMTLKLPVFSR